MKPAIYCLFLILTVSCTMRMPFPGKEGIIKIRDADIYYKEGGKGETLLLLHAGFLDTDMWMHQVHEFSRKYRVIAIDLPGHGRTENDTVRLYPADFIAAVLDSLKVGKASIIGVSMGAVCATDFLIAHPHRVNKAVLVGPGISGWETKFAVDTFTRQYVTSFFSLLNSKDTAGAAEAFTKYWFDGPFRSPQQVNDTLRRYIYETTLGNMRKHKVRGWPILANPPAIEKLNQVKVPLMVIHGDKDAPYITQASSYIEKTVPGAKRVLIPYTGHMLNMEMPEKFNRVVHEFLEQ